MSAALPERMEWLRTLSMEAILPKGRNRDEKRWRTMTPSAPMITSAGPSISRTARKRPNVSASVKKNA